MLNLTETIQRLGRKVLVHRVVQVQEQIVQNLGLKYLIIGQKALVLRVEEVQRVLKNTLKTP